MSKTLEQAEQRAKYYGGHEFDYESVSDLFKCCYCKVYEVVAREGATEDAPIKLCPGLAVWAGETERRYFQARKPGTADMSDFREVDALAHSRVRDSGVVRSFPYSRRLDASTTAIYETTPAHLEDVLESLRYLPGVEVDLLELADVDRIIAAFVNDRNARDGKSRGYIADLRPHAVSSQ